MLEVHLEEDGEITTTGEVKVDDIYTGLCCAGYDWEIVMVFEDTKDKRYTSIWGVCRNPNCPIIEDGFTKEEDYYHGVSHIDLEDMEEMLATNETFSKSGEKYGRTGQVV
ncbi:MAG: hypothetical protein WC449_05020 [Candidatus Paceibacterota bacterium]